MKIYAPKEGFSQDDIKQGNHWLRTDVICTVCNKEQPLAMAGSTDNGECIRCGGKTS